jgi:hypothetical protein
MITLLQDYIETEEKYGHSAKECREHKIATAKETVQLLKRMSRRDRFGRGFRATSSFTQREFVFMVGLVF